ncbi:DUF7287 family protein [Halomarina salina]|uniref:DUF7287 family protein n=1 Tax=Halomarina salina TaxID=1872699 RepID=UPI003F62BCE3
MPGRGQTTLDFAIGVSVFLLAVAFVFSFVPGMVQPFSNSGQEEMAASNRLASQLATDALTEGEPYVFDPVCTTEFFRHTPTGSPDCDFDQSVDLSSGGRMYERLDSDRRLSIHAALIGDADGDGTENSLCLSDSGSIIETDDGTCTVEYDTGDSVPSSGSVVTASRRVSIDGIFAELVVKIW